MATQNLVEQVIIFIYKEGAFDESAIFANSLIQSLASNSAGQDIIYSYRTFVNLAGGVATFSGMFELRCYVQPSFVATVQANIPNLQAAFPQYTIATWGGAVTFGN